MKLSRVVSLTSLNAALYATLGYASYLGLFTPVIGVVRFWPSVFVPALFAILFGGFIGGLGAAIGIFISDMLIHGNMLLSLTVGVPSNFLCFFVIGTLHERVKSGSRVWLLAAALEELGVAALVIALLQGGLITQLEVIAYLLGIGVAAFFTIVYGGLSPGIALACNTGLILGSGIIGLGVYAYSQFFTLPSGASQLPLSAALIWFVWTYATEIPFMVALVPPLAKAVEKVLPGARG